MLLHFINLHGDLQYSYKIIMKTATKNNRVFIFSSAYFSAVRVSATWHHHDPKMLNRKLIHHNN